MVGIATSFMVEQVGMSRPQTKMEFYESMTLGTPGTFVAYNQSRVKEFLAIAVRAHINKFDTQQEAADKWGVSQPTISNIVNDNLTIVKSSYLLDILFKVGAEIEVTVR